jgi:hypothetical protein
MALRWALVGMIEDNAHPQYPDGGYGFLRSGA